ncbi:HGxxPAAW family protein [Actinomadura sp. DC4]|uniref:HGxxPAAW family protein n=1 Tax=Actinomadura sp. DC4 TaxID=3055069 RepID=UPI0025AF7EA8|nr:HGxxPAAW family protein [Actinomadura sp. DC4]MDN3355554.1 HGxxPAAW family protein [Actinomadura sp. DC4]
MAQNSHAGRASSWLAVIVIWIGFGVGGASLVPGPKWWMFWVGVGIVVVGGVIGAAVHIFDDVIMDGPREVPEERHHSELAGGRGEANGPGIATDPATTRPHG